MMNERKEAQRLLGSGEYNLARELFQRILRSASKDPMGQVEAHLGLGLCDQAQKQFNTAADHFESAMEIHPNLAAVENLIEVYSVLGEKRKKIEAAEKGLRLACVPQGLKAKYLTLVAEAGNA